MFILSFVCNKQFIEKQDNMLLLHDLQCVVCTWMDVCQYFDVLEHRSTSMLVIHECYPNLGAGGTWTGSASYFYLTHVERFPMGYWFYGFRDTIEKVHTDPPGDTETPSCTRKFKMLQCSCNTCHIVPLIVRSKKVNHMIYFRCCVVEI